MSRHIHTSHTQLVALWLACVGWTLTTATMGLIQWRVWYVADKSVISSGVAWVGIWRACFNSHTLVTPELRVMFCRGMGIAQDFTPPEVAVAQVLLPLSILVGFGGIAGGVYALRNVYFGLETSTPIRLVFRMAGSLCLLATVMSLTPLLWNLSSVATNQTIHFPPDFHLPPAPVSQQVGAAISVGIIAAILMTTAGIMLLSYRLPARTDRARWKERRSVDGSASATMEVSIRGKDNLAFEFQEHL
ncbi:claudin-34-like [Lampris incognitus]|uniref:claudin-34-like n=1 Tax=Lampris incognitus TaxID=2546036 RepID=UPI0024B59428|nr:claudin-34-like [Lampris incognitus]